MSCARAHENFTDSGETFAGPHADALAAIGFAPKADAQGLAQLASVPRLRLIVEQNTRMAQECGHYQQWEAVKDYYPVGVWHCGYAEVHRPEHLARNGKAYEFDHPIWTQSPPGGEFNCHCWRENLTREAAAARGLVPESNDSLFQPSSLGFDPSRPLDRDSVQPGKRVLPEYAQQAKDSKCPGDVLEDMDAKTAEEEARMKAEEEARKAHEEYVSTRNKWLDGLRQDGLFEEQLDAFRETYTEELHKEAKHPPLIHILDKTKDAFYNPEDNSITIYRDKNDWYGAPETIRHEMGHFLDEWIVCKGKNVELWNAYRANNNNLYWQVKAEAIQLKESWIKAVNADRKNLINIIKDKCNDPKMQMYEIMDYLDFHKDMINIEFTGYSIDIHAPMQERKIASALQDTIGEMFEGRLPGKWGHGDEYYKKEKKEKSEGFTHMIQLLKYGRGKPRKITGKDGKEQEVSAIEYLFPEMTKYIKGVAGTGL